MNKAQILEIKKQLKKDTNVITRIASCYVDAHKEIKSIKKEAFYGLNEEDVFKYEEIFKKTLSGGIGKNLISIYTDNDAHKDGRAIDFLYKLYKSDLADDNILETFFKSVIEKYEYNENYYIILVDIKYDVPGKALDNIFMDDASDEVYHAILCSICPVKLSKSGLSYDEETNEMSSSSRDWIVQMPLNGFLYPAFTDRKTDLHKVLYYSKSTKDINTNFAEKMFESPCPMSANEQKTMIEELFRKYLQIDYETMSNIYDNVTTMIEEYEEQENDNLVLTKQDIIMILSKSKVDDESIKRYEDAMETDICVIAQNIINTKKAKLKRAGVTVDIENEYLHLVKPQVIDGRKCLVIEVDDNLEFNDLPIKTL